MSFLGLNPNMKTNISKNQGKNGALKWNISRKLMCTVGFLLHQRYSIIIERHGDRNSRPNMIAKMMKNSDPNMKKTRNSAGLFLNECCSSMLEYR